MVELTEFFIFDPGAIEIVTQAMIELKGAVDTFNNEAQGNIGRISPVSAHFCGECNRLRLTQDGKLKPCLHAADEYSIKGLDFDGMKAVMEQAIWNKPAWHGDLDAINRSKAGRNMNEIGG